MALLHDRLAVMLALPGIGDTILGFVDGGVAATARLRRVSRDVHVAALEVLARRPALEVHADEWAAHVPALPLLSRWLGAGTLRTLSVEEPLLERTRVSCGASPHCAR